jgi:hypothetical protein
MNKLRIYYKLSCIASTSLLSHFIAPTVMIVINRIVVLLQPAASEIISPHGLQAVAPILDMTNSEIVAGIKPRVTSERAKTAFFTLNDEATRFTPPS